VWTHDLEKTCPTSQPVNAPMPLLPGLMRLPDGKHSTHNLVPETSIHFCPAISAVMKAELRINRVKIVLLPLLPQSNANLIWYSCMALLARRRHFPCPARLRVPLCTFSSTVYFRPLIVSQRAFPTPGTGQSGSRPVSVAAHVRKENSVEEPRRTTWRTPHPFLLSG
jgi:hypothetical protein